MRWDLRRTYLAGLEEEGLLGREETSSEMPVAGRTADTGQAVFDIGGMITDLEAEREKRRQGGG